MAKMGTLTVRLDDLYDGAKQDLADGAALRWLREALEADDDLWSFDLHPRHGTDNPPAWQVEIWKGPFGAGMLECTGATIAEAADKCRETLRGPAT